MSFAQRPPPRRAVERVPMPVVRMFLLAAVAVAASAYAIIRYYSHPPLPMIVQVPVDAGELPAPDLVTVDY